MQIADASSTHTPIYALFPQIWTVHCQLLSLSRDRSKARLRTKSLILPHTNDPGRGSGSSRSRCRINSDSIISILKPGNKGPDENKDNYKNYPLTASIAGAIHLSVFTVHCIAWVWCRLSLSIGLVSPGKSCCWRRSVTQSVIF